MPKFYFIPLLCLTQASLSQQPTKTDSIQNIFSADFLKTRRFVDSTLHPVKYAKTLEEFLSFSFPKNQTTDGRWVFYPDNANIEKINKPAVKEVIPNFNIYRITMTNYLGYHVNQGTCLVLIDSLKSNTILVEPLWYGGTSKTFLKLFIGHKFISKDSLLAFMTQINELMQIGSGYKFRLTSYSDSLITYDLGYFKGDSYTTGGNGTSSTVNYNDDGVWRKIRIEIKDLQLIRYTAVNPKMNDKEVVE
jgi:hypothetical protein